MFRARRANRVLRAVACAVLSAAPLERTSHAHYPLGTADPTAQARISWTGERRRLACWFGGLAETIFYAINSEFATLQQPFGQRPERKHASRVRSPNPLKQKRRKDFSSRRWCLWRWLFLLDYFVLNKASMTEPSIAVILTR